MSTIIFIYIILFIIILLVGYNIKSIEKFKNSKSCINEKNIKTCNTRYNCVWCDVENNCININNFTRENCFKPPVIKKNKLYYNKYNNKIFNMYNYDENCLLRCGNTKKLFIIKKQN